MCSDVRVKELRPGQLALLDLFTFLLLEAAGLQIFQVSLERFLFRLNLLIARFEALDHVS